MQLIVVPVVASFPANVAEMGILSSVMLGMHFKTSFCRKGFIALFTYKTFNSMHRSFFLTIGRIFQQTKISVVSLAVEKTITSFIHKFTHFCINVREVKSVSLAVEKTITSFIHKFTHFCINVREVKSVSVANVKELCNFLNKLTVLGERSYQLSELDAS